MKVADIVLYISSIFDVLLKRERDDIQIRILECTM